MTKSKKRTKNNISFLRRLAIYYKRFVFMLKMTLVVFISFFMFTNLFKGTKEKIWGLIYHESAKQGFILENVIIEGQKNASYKDIIELLGEGKGSPIFAINIQEVKDRLEGHAWVKAAVVERQLPSTIYIAITERTPVAIWQFKQKLYLIDAGGNRIAKYEGENFENLLQVVGQDANIYAKNLIDDLNKHPSIAAKVKSAVRFGQRRWNLNLDQKITVKMPEDNFNVAYNYLLSLDEKQRLFDQNYKLLDLRDSTKYYLEKY